MIAEEMQEYEQLLLEWLAYETPVQRRRFLESHSTLLDSQSDQLFRTLKDAPTTPFNQTFLQHNQEILQDGRQRGGDLQAIRAAYVNAHSGFALDLPSWLSSLIEEVKASEEYAWRKERFLEALARAQDTLAPEILAELSYQIAQACHKQADAEESPRFLAEALSHIQLALKIYTRDLYPLQFAKTAYLAAHLHYHISGHSKRPGFHIQQSLTLYEGTASIWTREAFATSWLLTQREYIDALLDRYQYGGQDSDLAKAQSLAYDILLSSIPDASDTLLITISLLQISFIYWSRLREEEELEHGLHLAKMARDFALASEQHNEFRAECAGLLVLYGAFLGASYLQTLEKESLEQSIRVRKEALEYALPTDSLLYLWQAQLSLALLERYFLTWQAEDLEEALRLSQQALQLLETKIAQAPEKIDELIVTKNAEEIVGQTDPMYASAYFASGYCLLTKHIGTWEAAMLNQAIEYLEKAVKCTPRFSPDLPIYLSIFSSALIRRHETAADLASIQRGIAQIGPILLGMLPETNTLSSAQLCCMLSMYLGKRYELLGDYQDILLAIDICRYALYDVPPQTSLHATLNANLGSLLLRKHALSSSREDREEAVRCCQDAFEATEETSQLFPFAAFSFASALQVSYIYETDPEILEKAITILLNARRRLAPNAPLQGEILVLFVDILQFLYRASGQKEYIDLIIDISHQSLKTTAPTYPRRFIFLYEFSQAWALSYGLTGRREDLQAMLQASEQALELIPEASPYRALIFYALSESLHKRYLRTGSLEDLERAFAHLQNILTTLPPSSVLRPVILGDLGQCYLERFQHKSQLEDLTQALYHLSLAVETVTGFAEQGLYRMSLESARLFQAIEKREIESLEGVVIGMREALSHFERDNIQWCVCANALSQTLCIVYEANEQREPAYLEEAIHLSAEALEFIPHTAPDRVSLLVNQGRALRARFQRLGKEEDERKARASFEEACEKGLMLSLESALSSAAIWGNWAASREAWHEAGQAYSYAIRALDLLYHEQISLTHKRLLLTSAMSLDTLNWSWVNIYEQAAYALARADLIREAVTSLEQGRARELGEKLARDRANSHALKQERPELYQRFHSQISQLQSLENADLIRSKRLLNQEMGVIMPPLVEQIRQARTAYAETLAEIRKLPGYADFQLDLSYERIAQAALPEVPLVYIVVTTRGSLALLVPPSGAEPEAIRTEDLKLDNLLLGGYLAGQSVLNWLRSSLTDSLPDVGAELIQRVARRLHELNAKGVVLIPADGSGVIPFHAAPYLTQGQIACLLDDFAVSYAPSARVLMVARQEASKRRSNLEAIPQHLLGVGNPLPVVNEGEGELADLPALPYTKLEIEEIRQLFTEQHATTFYGSSATREALWAALPQASILHLSCHASFHTDEPLDSAFLLAQNGVLSLRDLLEADAQLLARLQLAVLPACQTAVTDMQNLPNEAIGLFAGFLYTGVPAVIGTLWPVEQRSAALLMIRFYDLYLGNADALSDQKRLHPSTALRLAQCWLRDQTYETLEAYTAEQARRGRLQLAMWLEHYLRAALEPREEKQARPEKRMRPYAHPYYWAAFVYYGA